MLGSLLAATNVAVGRRAPTRQLREQPFAGFTGELSMLDRFQGHSGPTRLSNVGGGFREQRSLSSESPKSAASLMQSPAASQRTTADGQVADLTKLPTIKWMLALSSMFSRLAG